MSRDSKYAKQNNSVLYAPIFVRNVLKNVKGILIWIIVKSVHRYVINVQKNVVRCRDKNKLRNDDD